MQETQVRSLVRKIPWRRKWQPISVSLPGEFHGLRSLVDYSPWGHNEMYTFGWLHNNRQHVSSQRCHLYKNNFWIQMWDLILKFILEDCMGDDLFYDISEIRIETEHRRIIWTFPCGGKQNYFRVFSLFYSFLRSASGLLVSKTMTFKHLMSLVLFWSIHGQLWGRCEVTLLLLICVTSSQSYLISGLQFPQREMEKVPSQTLTVAFWPAYRFLRRQLLSSFYI